MRPIPDPFDWMGALDPFDWMGPLDEPVPLHGALPIPGEADTVGLVEPVNVETRTGIRPPSRSSRWRRSLVVGIGCALAFAHGWTTGQGVRSNAEIHWCGATHCPGPKGE